MPNFDALIAPFQKTVQLLKNGQLVPFQKWEVRLQLDQTPRPKMPRLNLSVPGLPAILQLIPGAALVLDDIGKLLKDIMTLNFQTMLGDLAGLVPNTLNFVGQQLGLGLSLIAVIGQLPSQTEEFAATVTKAYQNYFFGDGYAMLDGGKISPPTFGADLDSANPSLSQIAAGVRNYASYKTAEQYIRDLIRITVEASADSLFHLDQRYKVMMDRTDDLGKQEQTWFKGFSSLAESMVTSAVEEAAQGVSTFSTNPLIAASLGTFAGTAARKATQDAMLIEFAL